MIDSLRIIKVARTRHENHMLATIDYDHPTFGPQRSQSYGLVAGDTAPLHVEIMRRIEEDNIPIEPYVPPSIDELRDQAKERLRAERAALMKANDDAYMAALKLGQDTTAIVAESTRLRNITTLVDQCTTIGQLNALTCASIAP